jgi:hypothetical protein
MEKREESVFCGHANTDNLVAAHLLAPVLALVSKILMRFSDSMQDVAQDI